MDGAPPAKRLKVEHGATDTAAVRTKRAAFLDSLSRPVSPPGQSKGLRLSAKQPTQLEVTALSESAVPGVQTISEVLDAPLNEVPRLEIDKIHTGRTSNINVLASPIQLTKIRDLPYDDNVDTASLHDILGDPLIKEAWIFNFCFDVDWLMQYFDPDVRDAIQVKVIHGSWRKEDMNKIMIDDACSRRPNVKAIQAYLPDAFGTHHSKMFVLFRHDDHAQVIIHTANMLSKDWTNMTQALWRSPLLPLKKETYHEEAAIGVGGQFKTDLLRYLQAYGGKLKPLTQQLQLYDFTSVRAAIIASVPSRFKVSAADRDVWGWEMLRRTLAKVEKTISTSPVEPHFVFQMSSIASLPTAWLDDTLYAACGASNQSTSIIFPTAPDVANSLDGYAAGGSIHTKAQKPIHMKQISMMRPQMCRWTPSPNSPNSAGRATAAPHIKTYIRFASNPTKDNIVPAIDWALVTSSNLSTQAWGSAPKLAKGEKDRGEAMVHIQSYEIGVLVWPDLWRDTDEANRDTEEDTPIRMLPAFRRDKPGGQNLEASKVVGFRMPYDLPLTPYTAEELPWSPQSSYDSPDRHGRSWE